VITSTGKEYPLITTSWVDDELRPVLFSGLVSDPGGEKFVEILGPPETSSTAKEFERPVDLQGWRELFGKVSQTFGIPTELPFRFRDIPPAAAERYSASLNSVVTSTNGVIFSKDIDLDKIHQKAGLALSATIFSGSRWISICQYLPLNTIVLTRDGFPIRILKLGNEEPSEPMAPASTDPYEMEA
jgi:hypothetical protein